MYLVAKKYIKIKYNWDENGPRCREKQNIFPYYVPLISIFDYFCMISLSFHQYVRIMFVLFPYYFLMVSLLFPYNVPITSCMISL